MKIDTIPGESTDDKHKDWIAVESFSHSVAQKGAGERSKGVSTSGRTDHSDFTIVKNLDKASPKLALSCSNGEHIAGVKLELWRAGKDKIKYMEYKLSDVIVTSVRPSGSTSDEHHVPQEEVGFNYGKIEWVYTEMDHKTGKAKGDVKTSWSLVENKGG
ncbi:MAG: type VI secretion system tube protein Hcp [Verrucomicrobiia bacterium]